MITSTVFAEMQHTSICWQEDNDCSVKAIAIALNIRYAEAWYLCRKQGRKFRRGMPPADLIKILKTRKDLISVEFKGTIIRFMRMYPKGSYIFTIPGHMLAYKDGVVHDHIRNWHNDPDIIQIHHLVDKHE